MFDILFFYSHHRFSCKGLLLKFFKTCYFLARCKNCGRVQKGQCQRDRDYNIECKDCLKRFYSKSCYEWHMKAVCRLYHKCDQCFRIYYTYVPHICGEFFCRTCYVYHEPDKGCYISPVEDFKTDSQIIMVFDFEVHASL